MKYIDEFRDPASAQTLICLIKKSVTRPWSVMEVCGGQTHTIMKYGIQEILSPEITIIHGPGCPVCVTPVQMIDKAIYIASETNVILATFGDMLRVPGSKRNLLSLKAEGKNINIVYSSLDAVKLALENPSRNIVLFAIGFETTTPVNAAAVKYAAELGLKNFFLLCSQFIIPPVITRILSTENSNIDALLAAGHVCTVSGLSEYCDISSRYTIPVIITGFEPLDILYSLYAAVVQLENNKALLENKYTRAVAFEGNKKALRLIKDTFSLADREWRGLGIIPASGLVLNSLYSQYDAEKYFILNDELPTVNGPCISEEILKGKKKPNECSSFGNLCTPDNPLGAFMVSSEGVCSAYYKYKRI